MAGSLPLGEGESTRKSKQKSAENNQNPFDWGKQKSEARKSRAVARKREKVNDLNKECKNINSTLNFFLVLVVDSSLPPGSGSGLIPLVLPRQRGVSMRDLNQCNSLQWGAFASCNHLIALSVYDLRISSDYKQFHFFFNSANIYCLPVYSIIILSPSNPFLLLSPGTSFFPRPTFPNQPTNQFTYRQNIHDEKRCRLLQKPISKGSGKGYLYQLEKYLIKYIKFVKCHPYLYYYNPHISTRIEVTLPLTLLPLPLRTERKFRTALTLLLSPLASNPLLPTLLLPLVSLPLRTCLLYTSPSPRD